MKTASISSSNFTAKKCNDSISLSSLDFFCGRCRTIMFGEKVDATLRQRLKPNVLPIYATTILTSTALGYQELVVAILAKVDSPDYTP